MDEFKSNSHKSREAKEPVTDEKRVRQVVNNPVKVKKKSGLGKIADIFLSEDASSIKHYLIWEELIPAIKDLASRMIKTGTDIAFYGEKRSAGASTRSRSSYSSYYEKSSERRSYEPTRIRSAFDYEDFVIASRPEAEEILDELQDAINRFGVARVNDLYDIFGRTAPLSGGRYGWRTIQGTRVISVGDGYVLKLPKPQPID